MEPLQGLLRYYYYMNVLYLDYPAPIYYRLCYIEGNLNLSLTQVYISSHLSLIIFSDFLKNPTTQSLRISFYLPYNPNSRMWVKRGEVKQQHTFIPWYQVDLIMWVVKSLTLSHLQ